MEHGDLVKRLRKQAAIHSASMRIGAICKAASGQAMSEAADALEAAQAENAKLRAELAGAREAALEEAAKVADAWATDAQRQHGKGGPASAIRALNAAKP